MATPPINKHSTSIKRILREHRDLVTSPSSSYTASPLASDLFQWHFTLRGPPSSAYERGLDHGRIDLPPNYPFAPPSCRFLTASGRFEANRPICLSISGHHEESWQPAWGIRTALVALRSFMESEPRGQVGGMDCSAERRRELAEESRGWRCRDCGGRNDELLKEGEETEEKVPDELRLQYRDQLGKEVKAEEGKINSATKGSATGEIQRDTAVQGSQVARASNTRAEAAIPTQHQPEQDTAALRIAEAARPPPPPPDLDDPASAWLDSAIIGVGAMLGFMIFKKAFGLEIL